MNTVTLADLRKQSGRSIGSIHASMQSVCPEIAPKSRSGVIHWETQGIMDVRVIRALSIVYLKPFEVVESAALLSRAAFLSRKKIVPKKVTLA